jgi:hypothetical protein
MTYKSLLLLFSSLFLTQCGPDSREKWLPGRWTAYGYEVADSARATAYLDQIQLTLSTDQRYHFRSTLDYEEAGRYHLRGNLLITTDTTVEAQKDKKMRIEKLNNDTLILLMRFEDEDRRLMMRRTE